MTEMKWGTQFPANLVSLSESRLDSGRLSRQLRIHLRASRAKDHLARV